MFWKMKDCSPPPQIFLRAVTAQGIIGTQYQDVRKIEPQTYFKKPTMVWPARFSMPLTIKNSLSINPIQKLFGLLIIKLLGLLLLSYGSNNDVINYCLKFPFRWAKGPFTNVNTISAVKFSLINVNFRLYILIV